MAVLLSLFAGAGQQFFTNAGVPLAGGKIFTYGAGGSTPQATYTTSAGNIAHSNPIVLDAAGRVPSGGEIWLTSNLAYKFVLQTSANVTVQTLDNVGGGVDGATLAASSGSSLIGFIQAGSGAVARTVQSKLRDVISVKDFGAVGDGVTNDTSAILNALASLTSGGALYFPAGTYKFQRGTGILLSDTITVSNVLIYGDGAASKISGYNAAGSIPNDVGNQFYNVFQATSRSNITIKDMAFEGYTTPASMFSCTNVVVDNVFDNGQLANAGGYMRDKSIYLEKCADVRIVNSRFINFQFAIYVGGDGTTSSSRVIVNACSFEHTTAAGSYTTLFPVGVYWYYSAECVVNGCTFLNIYSSVDSGTTGTGMGYGVYEGDGATTSGVISNNVFRFNAKGSKNAMGIYLNEMQECSISGNTFFVPTNGRMVTGIYLDSKNQDSKYSVTGNTFDIKSTAVSIYPIYVTGTSTNSPKIAISGNTINGGFNGIRQDGLGNAKLNITGNNINASTSAGIQLSGEVSLPLKNVVINGNTVTGSGTNAIYFNQYVVSPSIMNNTLLDGNTTNQAGDLGAAILFVSVSYGSFIANNIIGNTAYGGGLFTLGVQNAANATNRIFKDITAGNAFVGFTNNNQLGRYWTSSPTNQIFDTNKGDFFQNVQLDASDVPGWFCVFKLATTVTADASSASTTVTVGSTSGVATGDIVLLCKDSNPYDGDYADTTKWHVDTVASVTSGTQFVLTTGIPAGDGTYVGNTAVCHFARFKAAAAIAA